MRYFRPKRMTARYGGTCVNCGKLIFAGDDIFYANRRAWHNNCNVAAMTADNCTNCSGSGRRWNNELCVSCDGTGTRNPAPVNHVEDYACSDAGYEDSCREACGL